MKRRLATVLLASMISTIENLPAEHVVAAVVPALSKSDKHVVA